MTEENIKNNKKTNIKNKWISYTFGPEPMEMTPFEIDPVTDIPLRLAAEKGVISRKRDLALYRINDEWNGHPKNSILICGPIEEKQPFAIWIGDGSYTKPDANAQEQDNPLADQIPDEETDQSEEAPYEQKANQTTVPLYSTMTYSPRKLFSNSGMLKPKRMLIGKKVFTLFNKIKAVSRNIEPLNQRKKFTALFKIIK